MTQSKDSITRKLFDFVELSSDAYAIYDQSDKLVYCNATYVDLFSLTKDEAVGMTFSDILRQNFRQKRGVNVNSGDIEAFVNYVASVKGSKEYRLFEVDFIDGRWFLFSEQLNNKGELLVQLTDITRQKVTEHSLESRLSEMKTVALTDQLTGIANRRALVESINVELERCRRAKAKVTLAVLDLDFFKHVNDTYGHLGGDEVLRAVSALVKRLLRPYDTFGRIGGEEFALFFSDTELGESISILQRIREQIESSPILFEGQSISITASVGVTTLDSNTDFIKLYEQADAALYQAKSAGRNRVIAYNNSDSEIQA